MKSSKMGKTKMIMDTGIRTRNILTGANGFHANARIRGLVTLGMDPLMATKIASKAKGSDMTDGEIKARYDSAIGQGMSPSVASTFCVSRRDLGELARNYRIALDERVPSEGADEFVNSAGGSFGIYLRQFKHFKEKGYSASGALAETFKTINTNSKHRKQRFY